MQQNTISTVKTSNRKFQHSDTQAEIIAIGKILGYEVFASHKEKKSKYGRLKTLTTITTLTKESVEMTGKQINNAKDVDVIWLNQKNVMAFFEVEHTTKIEVALSRLKKLNAINAKKVIVGAPTKRSKIESENSLKNLHFLSFDEIESIYDFLKRHSSPFLNLLDINH